MGKGFIKSMGIQIVSALAILPAIGLTGCTSASVYTLNSPDGKTTVTVSTEDGQLYYSVMRDGQPVIDNSRLSMRLREGNLGDDVRITDIHRASIDENWDQPWGEELTVRNNYNELTVDLEENSSPARQFSVVFRAFDDGVGFRYSVPEQENLTEVTIDDEDTQFAIASDATTWSIPWDHPFYEALYRPAQLGEMCDTVASPLTMRLNDSLYVTIHEAALTDYASMNLYRPDSTNRLATYLTPWSTGEKVRTQTPFNTPWRTIIIGRQPGDLMLSRLMLNLNEPCAIDDISWIEPGRYIGIWWAIHMKDYTWHQGPKHGANTANTKRYIDFAAANGYQGVLVEGWNYGWDGDWTAHGHPISFTKPYPDFDIKEITDYAHSKGVKLVGHHETGGNASAYESQIDSAMALYASMGVNAVKTGYVNNLLDNKELHGSQYGVRHYRKVIETAARHHIMIDNHEPVMPTGLQRTYPNLMTQEGVRGQEYDAWSPDGGNPPEHTVTIPFTRCLAGPVDFTPGTFNFSNTAVPTTRPNTTLAKQLALSVVIFSPLQMSSDKIENYEGRPELEFISNCPATWGSTVVPHASIGEYVTVARKDREDGSWWIGSITNADSRDLTLQLSFLDKDRKYKARIFADGADADYIDNPYPVEITEIEVDSTTEIPLHLARSGGAAIMIRPVS